MSSRPHRLATAAREAHPWRLHTFRIRGVSFEDVARDEGLAPPLALYALGAIPLAVVIALDDALIVPTPPRGAAAARSRSPRPS